MTRKVTDVSHYVWSSLPPSHSWRYLPQQEFSIDETGLFWERMPSRMFVSVQKVALGFKASEDHCMLVLGGNASGNYKMNLLLVYHSENLWTLRVYSKEILPIVWRSNKKAWITASFFESYFASELKKLYVVAFLVSILRFWNAFPIIPCWN